MQEFQTQSSPPENNRRSHARRLLRLDTSAAKGLKLRNSGFWAGWGGLITTIGIGVLVVALLVGWVLLWASRGGTPSVVFLITGSMAFGLILAALFTLLNRVQAHAKLRQVEAAFLAGTSHGLRTPLAGIRASAQALRRLDLSPDEENRLIQALDHEAQRLNLRIDNILETNRLMLEKVSFIPECINITKCVERLVSSYENEVRAKEGSIDVQLPENLEVRADPRGLELVLENLLDNAVKYSPEKPSLSIDGLVKGSFVLIRIRDGGRGFLQAESNQFFRRFSRGDQGSKGVGLGLALCQAIVNGHGGSLSLFSPGPDQGCTAELWWPQYTHKKASTLPHA